MFYVAKKPRKFYKYTTPLFIEKSKETHGSGRYDYSLATCSGAFDTVTIICHRESRKNRKSLKIEEHGEYIQRASDHANGKGCPKCANLIRGGKRITTEEFIKKAKKHYYPIEYDYSETVYANARCKVTVICPKSGHGRFSQSATSHLHGNGCPKCAYEARHRDTAHFITASNKMHGEGTYDYSKVDYTGSSDKVTIGCYMHGDFEQIASSHMYGTKCPPCSRSGFDPEKPAILYYLRVFDGLITHYKMGVSHRSLYEQVTKSSRKYVIAAWAEEYSTGVNAYLEEQKILKKYKEYVRTDSLSFMIGGASSRRFTKDVLASYWRSKKGNTGVIVEEITQNGFGKHITTESYIEKAKAAHSDKNYDYSRTVYVRADERIIVICPIHSEFYPVATVHASGLGYCPKCPVFTLKDFLKKANEQHGEGTYDYSKVVYNLSQDYVTIICLEHGEFSQKASGHLQGYGCNQCSAEKAAEKAREKNHGSTAEFIKLARKKHGPRKYKYNEDDDYVNLSSKMTITCRKHGIFRQGANSHLLGAGCPTCSSEAASKRQRGCTKDFIKAARASKHGYTYGYSKVKYVLSSEKVIIICPEHGDFKQTPGNHLNGSGCPLCCKRYGFDPKKEGILYYLRIFDGLIVSYKIGITTRSIKERFSKNELKYITVLWEERYPTAGEAWIEEQKIIKKFRKYLISKSLMVIASGRTETFTKDILKSEILG